MTQSFTVPEPFELSAGMNSDARKKKMLKALKQREMSECTFKPATNEGRNKQMIKAILEEDAENIDCN